MLSVNDYLQLKKLYSDFFEISDYIKLTADEMRWDDLCLAIEQKNSAFRRIIFFEKSRINEIKDNPELIKIRQQLLQKEKDNIEFVKRIKKEHSLYL